MADGETQKVDFFKRIVEKVEGGGGSRQSFWIDKMSVRFVRVARHVPRVGPACDFTQICSERSSCCMSEGLQMVRQRVESSAKRCRGFSRESERSLMKTRKSTGRRTLP